MFTLTNPSAVTFPRFNADNTVSALDASTFRTAIGAGAGTVTSVATGTGLTGGPITGSGTISFSTAAVGTWAATPSSANLAAAMTDETGSGSLVFATRPSFANTIGVGGATASASGAGVTFPASQSASTDPNTLDDYEEGTYTPTIFSVVVGNGTVYGRYVLCGNMVFCSGSLLFGSTTTVSTYIRPSVPFVADPGNGSMIGGSAALSDFGTNTYIEAAIGQVYTSGDVYVKIQNSLTGSEAYNGSPFTFTTNDRIDWAFVYRRA
jgi:hypothetical protein